MLTTEKLQARIDRGCAYLDDIQPGWESRIDLDRLRLSNPCNCVLGQLFGDYCNHVFAANRPGTPELLSLHRLPNGDFAWPFGFVIRAEEIDISDRVYGTLDWLWITTIRARQQKVELPSQHREPAATLLAVAK